MSTNDGLGTSTAANALRELTTKWDKASGDNGVSIASDELRALFPLIGKELDKTPIVDEKDNNLTTPLYYNPNDMSTWWTLTEDSLQDLAEHIPAGLPAYENNKAIWDVFFNNLRTQGMLEGVASVRPPTKEEAETK